MDDFKHFKEHTGWVGVDFDGTIAEYHGWEAWNKLGKPIPLMVDRVKAWIKDGTEVRIVTARVGHGASFKCLHTGVKVTKKMMVKAIQDWCEEHVGVRLKVTNEKDYEMLELWDDRAIRVETNTGRII